MENGPNGPLVEVQVSEHTKNGVVAPIMAKFPDGNIAIQQDKTNCTESAKVNGDNITEVTNNDENSYSSESDALVIDESITKKPKGGKKKNNQNSAVLSEENINNVSDSVTVTHSNPYFNESLFELSQLHQSNQEINVSNETLESTFDKSVKTLKKKGKPKPKIKEYAQYLGLQPSVQFKCPKCNRAGFESLSSLQEHVNQCNEEIVQEATNDNSYSGFKLTRRVFLCTVCGTYYENWNLYIHMLEFHKRYICLYCLGMFSILEDLCQHIQSRHNLEPGYKNTLDEFFNVYNEPCYIVCCECNKIFSEQDNFFYHNCVNKNKCKKTVKQQITPENHVTGESESIVETNTGNMEEKSVQNTDNMKTSDTLLENADSLENHQKEDHGNETDKKSLTITSNTNESNHPDDIEAIENQVNCNSDTETNNKNNAVCNNEFNEDSNEEVGSNLKNNEDSYNSVDSMLNKTTDEHIDVTGSFGKSEEENTPHEPKIDEDKAAEEKPTDEHLDTRKVPKLSLKLPKMESYEAEAEDSDDSEKLTMEIDQIESENEVDVNVNPDLEMDIIKEEIEVEKESIKKPVNSETQLQVAGPDISIIELQLEQPLDKFDPRILLQKCLKMTVSTCIYCNHARKIAVNGKQLGLHCIAEHRFSAVVNSITAEELIPQNFVNRIKETLDELSAHFFNLDSSFSNEAVTFSHLFECFQCHFSTTVHKELYLHNRKFHSKNLLLCIMCKSNFYSYSELVCHLCPGVYVLDYEVQFRCCMCVHEDLPSSFRMMVHLRKKHNVCDVCLETCHTQHRLSNHVWKHKLHHFCYRCGIAYRNKPDITRHLFWKHGTESVLCKKCLQKKWPHVYHFCVPPSSFVCDECSLMFTKAVSLKVHKRLHTNEKKHACTFENCEEKFISKKLLEKHFKRHLEPPEEIKVEDSETNVQEIKEEVEQKEPETQQEEDKVEEKPKPKIDVLEDLPALNLSESDSSSESETEADGSNHKIVPGKPKEICLNPATELEPPGDLPPLDILQEDKTISELSTEETVIQNIWDNFKTYQEQQQKLDHMFGDQEKPECSNVTVPETEELNVNVIMQDHDYCVNPEQKAMDTTMVEVKPALTESVDHDYCFSKPKDEDEKPPTEIQETPTVMVKKEEKKIGSSSSSSSDSDSSSCSCGSNCSCSSSSGSSSSSSDSSSSDSSSEEGKQRQLAKKQKRKERAKKMKEEKEQSNKVDVVTPVAPIIETPIRESDLETTESETDEEFYDEAPQKLAKKILEEKRQQLLELMGPNSIPNGSFIESTSRPPTPPAEAVEPEERKKKKSKSKKKKRKKSEKKMAEVAEADVNNIIPMDIPIPPYYQQFHQQQQQQQVQPQTVAPITLTIPRNSPVSSPSASISTPTVPATYHKVQIEPVFSRQDSTESNLRASKRRRVPNKFYGYSSDEEHDKPVPKWRKIEAPPPPRSPQVVPPITIKTQPTPPPQPPIEPISIRTGTHLSDFRVARPRPKPSIPPIRLLSRRPGERESGSDSNDSSSEETSITPKPAQPQLYCYCQCPYDEVSEMIGCDATDCAIEWFHFECVGIMVPPKGQWFCPDCRKKKARRELLQSMKSQNSNS